MLEVNHFGRSGIHEAFAAEQGVELLDPAAAQQLPELTGLTHLSWQFYGEHCTECGAPDCHQTCDLFERGPAGLCRRLRDGIVVRRSNGAPFGYSLEVLFKTWGRLLCVANAYCVNRRVYRTLAPLVPLAGRLSYLIQSALRFLPATLQWRITDKIRGAGNRVPRWLNTLAAGGCGSRPNELLLVIGNPQRAAVTLEIHLSGFGESQGGRSFRRTKSLVHGWQTVAVPIEEITSLIDTTKAFRIALVPVAEKPVLLQVLYAGFVVRTPTTKVTTTTQSSAATVADKKVKLLVVDLDNTLWDGILIENPDRELGLRPSVKATLTELDRRGILLSIASRNNLPDVQTQLKRLGLWDLFLYPQVTWNPKSDSLQRIVEKLNIGMDTVAFIDDSPFERQEVTMAIPSVRVYDAAVFSTLPDFAEFTVPVTEESQHRRELYQQEQHRQVAHADSHLDYDAFLRTCNLQLMLLDLDDGNRDRVFELVQRTNQLNYSGNRYSRESLGQLLREPRAIPVVMHCRDRFGDYGIIGFALLRIGTDAVEVADMMLSCRIQGKKVEHSFLAHLARLAAPRPLVCHYTSTARNQPAARVFADLGFTTAEKSNTAQQRYRLSGGKISPESLPLQLVAPPSLLKRLVESKVD